MLKYFLFIFFFTFSFHIIFAENYSDKRPQKYLFQQRASELNTKSKSYTKIAYVLEKDGKPQDIQHASVDTRVKPFGQLVIWMMAYNSTLTEKLTSYGLHVIQPHYARQWFSKVSREVHVGEHSRGNMRLEAATGKDFSDQANIEIQDGMVERVKTYLHWLNQHNPQGNWKQFLTVKGDINWDKVIMAGSSHGSTTSARFAKYQKVARVVMLCGPRDQYQMWQSLDSETPKNRYFGFSHVLDSGWKQDHYCRSWELLGLNQFGPIIDVDSTEFPYQNSRRLISNAEVNNDPKVAHSAVTPGKRSPKDKNGNFLYEDVWKYLFTHPVDQVGSPSPLDEECCKDQRSRDFSK